ncbi:MAG: glucosyltransferase domain-containing protein [Lachnospiraceae bacterium]|nr:glucosyltransferase domain-containing protein [Lachnospiraceae bacterium]
MQNSKNKILQFCKLDYQCVAISVIWIIVLNGYRLFSHPIGVDTEAALYAFESNLNWTIGNGRIMSAIVRRLTMPTTFNYDIAVIIIILGLIFAVIGYQYCLKYFGITCKASRLLFSLIFVSYPTWAEQNYFVCSAYANVIGLCVAVYASYILTVWLLEKRKFKYALLACLLVSVATGIYQTFFYLIIANVVSFIFLKMKEEELDICSLIVVFIKLAMLIFLSFGLYLVFSKIGVKLFYKPDMDYAGAIDAPAYISNQISWKRNGILNCAKEIIKYIVLCFNVNNVFGTPVFLIVSIVALLITLYRSLKLRKKNKIVVILLWLCLNVCPFLGCLVKGGSMGAREQLIFPCVLAVFATYILENVVTFLKNSEQKGDIWKEVTAKLIIVLMFVLSASMASVQLQLNRTDYVRYEQDKILANHIIHEIEEFDSDYMNKKIVFMGYRTWKAPAYLTLGEVIGKTIFSWDYYGRVGVNYRVYGFMQAMGYSYVKPTFEDVELVRKQDNNSVIYPNEGCIYYVNDMIVVRLN